MNDLSKQYMERNNQTIQDMKDGKSAKIRVVQHIPVSAYNCVIYKPKNTDEIKTAYFGIGYENSCVNNLSISLCAFYVRALKNPQKLVFMRFDAEPGRFQFSSINGKVYMTDVDVSIEKSDELMFDEKLVAKSSDLIEINVYECAKQFLEDTNQNLQFIFSKENKNFKKYFNRNLKTLKLLLDTNEKELSQKDINTLKKNLKIIDEYDTACEKMHVFMRDNGIVNLDDKQKQTYKTLKKELNKAFKKF